MSTRTDTRQLARAAVRAQLARSALACFREGGFDAVTVSDVAAAVGVSTSTFLRYFTSKEEAVLGAFDHECAQVTQALVERPVSEPDWSALRRAFDPTVEAYRQEPRAIIDLHRLIRTSVTLTAGLREKQHQLREPTAAALVERDGASGLPDVDARMRAEVLVGAALACFESAVEHWVASDGVRDIGSLLDETFAVLTPTPPR